MNVRVPHNALASERDEFRHGGRADLSREVGSCFARYQVAQKTLVLVFSAYHAEEFAVRALKLRVSSLSVFFRQAFAYSPIYAPALIGATVADAGIG